MAMVGSSLKHIPGSIFVVFPFTRSGPSCRSNPIPCPVRCGSPGVLYPGPKPAPVITLRAAASTLSQVVPGRAAASAASCARRSRSHTSRCRSVGLADTATPGVRRGPAPRERRTLHPPLQVPPFALPLGRLAEHRGARDVALIAFHAAPIVDQYHVALAQLLRLYAAVRERRVFAENRHRRPAHPQRAEGR